MGYALFDMKRCNAHNTKYIWRGSKNRSLTAFVTFVAAAQRIYINLNLS